jgi:Ca-activated chloride channel family protein
MQTGKPSLTQICFVAIALILTFRPFRPARAQTDLNDVHIAPRVQSDRPDSPGSVARTTPGIIRTTVELVLVPVTVLDGSNRIVAGLERENFQLYEDKHPQPIKHFWKEDEPASVGIVLDVSGSMETKIDRAQDAVRAFLKASNPQDEFFLMTFADRPTLVHDFTQDVDDIQSELLFPKPKGNTSLLDAIVLAVDNMKKARYRRRALVIISDGGDNRSRYTEKDVKSLIKEQDLLVYSIGVFDRECRTQEERLGPELLEEVSSVTGASAYTLDNPNYLPVIAGHIATELRNQYILGYSPDGSRRDGKWRKIKVKLAVRHGLPAFSVRARTGYYGPAQ